MLALAIVLPRGAVPPCSVKGRSPPSNRATGTLRPPAAIPRDRSALSQGPLTDSLGEEGRLVDALQAPEPPAEALDPDPEA